MKPNDNFVDSESFKSKNKNNRKKTPAADNEKYVENNGFH